MKILNVTPHHSETVETDEGEYRRMGPNDWDELMGQSWEMVSFPEELEAAYQLFNKS